MECREKRDCRLRIVDFGFLIGKRKSGRRSGRSKINNQKSEFVSGVGESAGINRLGIENERVLQRKPSQ